VAWVPLRIGVEQIVAIVEAAARRAPAGPDLVGLTGREVEVLELIAEGLTNQEIADRVYISINSVKTYIRSAYRKIGVNSRSQAAVWGLQHGIVQRAK
jgi:DNA-binding CsgD family transcriptional regulator